jgi:hypothetical protein
MLLAEALTRRGDLMKKLVDLRDRATANARYQEGQEPAESTADLTADWEVAGDELQTLITRINITNSRTMFSMSEHSEQTTLTDALAEREKQGRRRKFYSELADAAAGSGRGNQLRWRFTRDEIVTKTDLDVPQLRANADKAAQRFREIDMRIQQLNWQTELL